MTKTFNFYCDESCHLENDRKPYMLIAYVSSAYNQVKIHQDNIRNIKNKHGYQNEIKWSAVSKAQYPFFGELIDYFFSNDLHFRAVVVDKSKISITPDSTYDDFYYKMYWQLIYHKLSMDANYNIYLDIKDTLSALKVQKLKQILQFDFGAIRALQNIRSDESLLMQLTDLLMGAISYHLRGLNKVIAKNKLIEKIEHHTNIDLKKSTYKSFHKFNLFFIDLK